ncbi:MAG TPA: helical backbone metal receptor [Cyclobacteriaceae bacterium]|nr:helical backbone metal receptor [Cyclobacteriaceae bacterium]
MPARRIVSLVPSQTELLYDLGLDAEVVGVTKFCVHPEEWRGRKAIVGGTKNVDHPVVDSLTPDLIIANKEENTKEDVERLMKKYKVWVSDIATVDDAFKMIETIGGFVERKEQAKQIVAGIRHSFSRLPVFEIKKAVYMIWKKPWMAAGSDTFISSMMKVAGFENVVLEKRYPEVSEAELKSLKPEVVLLSTEPYPFKEQHVEEIKRVLPGSTVRLVDGEMFSWYGSRMGKAAEYFEELKCSS